jgi:transcriptional regulator with XRE-family HTH domain
MRTLDLKQIRIYHNISQEDLAFKANLTVRTIQRIENGETKPRQDTLDRIANALSVSVDQLFIEKKLDSSNNDNEIQLLKISQFLFPFYLLGFIAPLVIKTLKKSNSKKFNGWANEIINFQFSWIVTFALAIIFVLSNSSGILMLIPLIILINRFNLLKRIHFMKDRPLLKSSIVVVIFVLSAIVLNFGFLIALVGFNIYMIIKSLTIQDVKDYNTVYIRIPIMKNTRHNKVYN